GHGAVCAPAGCAGRTQPPGTARGCRKVWRACHQAFLAEPRHVRGKEMKMTERSASPPPGASFAGLPARQGLYDPRNEHDACGVGMIAHLKARKSRKIVDDALEILENLTHRGAVGADPLVGDGAGILLQLPDRLLRRECAALGIELPEPGQYGVGHLFMPQDREFNAQVEAIIEEVVRAEGQTLLGFRDVPVDNSCLSQAPEIRAAEPVHRQVLIARNPSLATQAELERRLYGIRKVI